MTRAFVLDLAIEAFGRSAVTEFGKDDGTGAICRVGFRDSQRVFQVRGEGATWSEAAQNAHLLPAESTR